MKILYSIIIFSLFLFGTALLSKHAGAAVCQNKTVITYSNGMFTKKSDARKSLKKLKEKLVQKSLAFDNINIYDYGLAYANGKGGPLGTTGLDQLLEAAKQAYGDKFMGLFWRALMGDGLISDLVFRSTMQGIASSFNQVQYVDDQDAIKMGNDYRTFLGEGKRILIVAHSQGNFYTNAVYDKLTTENPAWASSIGVVAVATPASSSPGGKLGLNEPNITVPEDFVIAAVRNTFGSLPSKSDQWLLPGSSNVFQSGLSWLNFEQTTLGHSFVGWYLAGTYTRDFIMNGIIQTVDGVNGVGGLQYPSALGGGNITLDGVLPNAAATAALQYAVASGASAIPSTQPPSMRLLSTGARSLTISTCTGSGFSINKSSLGTPDGKNFLTAMVYNQDRWRFLSVGPSSWTYGPSGIETAMSFPSLAELRAYADPRLLGTYFPYCSNPSIVASSRMSGITTINVYELINQNSVINKRCDWFAIYEAFPYFDGYGAMTDDYYVATDKQAWADGLLQKVKAYYGAGI